MQEGLPAPGPARRPMQACPGKYWPQFAFRGRAHSAAGATGASSTCACTATPSCRPRVEGSHTLPLRQQSSVCDAHSSHHGS